MNWTAVLILMLAISLGYLALTGRYSGVWGALTSVPAAPSSIAPNQDTLSRTTAPTTTTPAS